jgi:tetratricopeptide (TPR) repeat protein
MSRLLAATLLMLLAACPGGGARKTVHKPGDTGGGGKLTDGKDRGAKVDRPKESPVPEEDPAGAMNDERIPGLDRTEAELAVTVEPHLQRARAAMKARDYETAGTAAQAALAQQGDHVEALRLLAQAYAARGWLDKARAVLDTGTQLPAGAKDAQLWMLLGLVHERAGDALDQAERAYTEATKLKPNYAAAWTNLGAIQLRLNRPQEAIASLETAQSIDDDSVAALTNLGTAYRRRAAEVTAAKDRDELLRKAERSYRAAIAVDEDSLAAYLDIGLLYFDADPFPGLATLARLQSAVRYLNEYKLRITSSNTPPAAPIDTYLDAARHALEREQRRLR